MTCSFSNNMSENTEEEKSDQNENFDVNNSELDSLVVDTDTEEVSQLQQYLNQVCEDDDDDSTSEAEKIFKTLANSEANDRELEEIGGAAQHNALLVCKFCPFFTHSSEEFEMHLKCHSEIDDLKQDDSKIYQRESGSLSPLLKKTYDCQICGKQLSSKCSLARHGLVHSGLKPYRCSVCGAAFTTSGNLSRHMKIHSAMQHHRKQNKSHALSTEQQLLTNVNFNHCCKPCGMMFKNGKGLRMHNFMIHRHKKGLSTLCALNIKDDEESKIEVPHQVDAIENSFDINKSLKIKTQDPSTISMNIKKKYEKISIKHFQHVSIMPTKSGISQNGFTENCIKQMCPQSGFNMMNNVWNPFSALMQPQLNQNMHKVNQSNNRKPECEEAPLDLSIKPNLNKIQNEPLDLSMKKKERIIPLQKANPYENWLHSTTISNPSQKYSCTNCPASFEGFHALRLHQQTHRPHSLPCAACGKSFSSEDERVQHVNEVHIPTLVSYNDAVRAMNHSNNASDHFMPLLNKQPQVQQNNVISKAMRDVDGKYSCNLCDKRFPVATALGRHVKYHNLERPYKCAHCDASFTYKYNCTRHISCFHRDKDNSDCPKEADPVNSTKVLELKQEISTSTKQTNTEVNNSI